MKSFLFPAFLFSSGSQAQYHPHINHTFVYLYPANIAIKATPLINSRHKKYTVTTPFVHLSTDWDLQWYKYHFLQEGEIRERQRWSLLYRQYCSAYFLLWQVQGCPVHPSVFQHQSCRPVVTRCHLPIIIWCSWGMYWVPITAVIRDSGIHCCLRLHSSGWCERWRCFKFGRCDCHVAGWNRSNSPIHLFGGGCWWRWPDWPYRNDFDHAKTWVITNWLIRLI